MKAIIIGTGKVGFQIAKTLSLQDHDVVVIEKDENKYQLAQNTLDVLAINGNGATMSILEKAGIRQADIIIAMTGVDEVNMIACMIAGQFGIDKKIARIRNPEYIRNKELLKKQIGIDFVINPEIATAKQIVNLLESPINVAQIEEFAGGKVQLFELRVKEGSSFVDKKLKDLNLGYPFLVIAIYRDDEIIIPHGEERIRLSDNVYILGGREHFSNLDTIIGTHPANIRNVMILGGSNIGIHTTLMLSKHGINTKLIEMDRKKCEQLASRLPDTLVINSDHRNTDLLKSEGIQTTDGFVAVTGDDESNILVSLMAKHLGSHKVIVKIDRTEYAPLMEKMGIDAVVNPKITTASVILRFIRKAKVTSLTLLREGKAEVMELVAQHTSKAVNKSLKQINLPTDSIVGIIVRNNKVIVPRGNDVIQPKDKVIIFTLPSATKKIEKIFAGK